MIIISVTMVSAGLLVAQLGVMYSDYRTARQFAQAAARNAAILDDDATRVDPDGDGFANFGDANVLAEAEENARGFLEFGGIGGVATNATWCGRNIAPRPICGSTVVAPGPDPGTVQVTVEYQSRTILPGITLGPVRVTGTASQRYTDQPIN